MCSGHRTGCRHTRSSYVCDCTDAVTEEMNGMVHTKKEATHSLSTPSPIVTAAIAAALPAAPAAPVILADAPVLLGMH